MGFAPISPLWPSRLACLHQHAAGWDPVRWYERPLPVDIDLAYLNAAPVDQRRTPPFGEDALYLENLHPRFAQLSTRLEVVSPVVTVDQGTGPEPLKLRCDTLIIDTDQGLATLLWRGHVLMDHPDRPGRVIVSGPDDPEVTILPRAAEKPIAVATMVPALQGPPAVVMPFAKATTPPAFPPSSPANPAKEQFAASDLMDLEGDGTHTLVPSQLPQAAALPFAGASRERMVPREPPLQPPPDIPPPSGLAAWKQLGTSTPAPNTTVASPPPVQEIKSVAPPPVQEVKSTPEPDATEVRLRLIQRAIWKGERPIEQILAEHGLTEMEWRAAKRASVRKSNS